jgi:GT2 family glycosyltransferase
MFPPQPPVPPAPGKAAPARPLTSIVMLSYNRLPYLRNTLSALLEISAGAPYELIVVDNGSSDGSAEFLQAAHEKGQVAKLLLLGENQGISAGYNQGFALADKNTGYFMKLDSDIKVLTQGWLGKVVDFLEANRQVGFVALNQVNDAFLTLLPLVRFGGAEVMDYSEWQLGSAMVFSKRLMDEIGVFIEDAEMTFVPDDIDYYVRASRKGYRAFYLRDVHVYHQWELDLKDYRAYTRGKPRDASIRLALRLARDYDRATRPLEVRYEKYAPAGER